MMKKAIDIIKTIAERTDRVILFHSASGKDSIALLDLISPYFKEIVCVYMYVVKDLSHINRYITMLVINIQMLSMCRFLILQFIPIDALGIWDARKMRNRNFTAWLSLQI
jgi:sulfate adenylyltransferase subunit 2